MLFLAGYMPIAERQKRGYFIGHKPSTQKFWRNRWCLAYGDWECPPGKTVSKHIPTHFQSRGLVKWGPISKEQEDEVERMMSLLSETKNECKNLVTQKNLFEFGLLQGMAGIIKGRTKVAVDLDDVEMQRRLRESRARFNPLVEINFDTSGTHHMEGKQLQLKTVCLGKGLEHHQSRLPLMIFICLTV
ncbi:unnamed protein product [Prunus brigantina]